MKKYILFFVSIGLLLGIVLVYNVIHVEESKKISFTDSGYILNGSSDRYYFYKDETYSNSYTDKIVFYDTEGAKVTLDNSNFIHYSSGNIVALQEGVLLDLSKLNDNPIIYYNIANNKEIKKISNRYSIKNLDTEVQFEQAIWKISPTKYIILANKLKVILNNGTEKEAQDYIEIEYIDNEIINIYNQEFSYQTISSDSYIELENGIKVNLGTKIVSQDDENKMTLEDMVINSDDNVTLVDLKNTNTQENQNETTEQEETDENNEIQVAGGGTTSSTSSSTSSTSTSTSTGVISGSGSIASDSEIEDEDTIDIETPEIIYEYVADNESKVDESVATAEPTFTFENMEVTAVGLSGNVQITDDDDLLSKNDDIIIKIINNSTGKTVYMSEESYGTYNIPVNVETLLPDTGYTLIASATYTVSENTYTKNFLYKTFVTSSIGVSLNKESFTDTTLNFNIEFNDSLIDSVEVSLLDSEGNTLANRTKKINNGGSIEEVNFDGLTPNTQYTVRVSNITYNGIIQEGENWKIDAECQTLKTKASIDKLNYSINKRDSTFTLYIEDITDEDNSIQNYKYVMYKFTQIQNEEGDYVIDYDTKNIVYQRETTSKEITLTVADEASNESIVRGQYYGFKIIATTYDNEKYVEIESEICGAFALNGATFPSVKFEKIEADYPPTEIQGYLYIIDNESTITVGNENPLTITYYSDVEESKVYVKRTSLEEDEITEDDQGNSVIKIWIDLGGTGNDEGKEKEQTKGLKQNTSYTFSVYGTVDLEDGNGEYDNVHIGSAIVTTGTYETLTANLTTEDISTNTFTVDLNLEGTDVNEEGLTSVSIMLYEGSGDINAGEYNNWSRTITTKNYSQAVSSAKYSREINSLQDLLFDNTLVITPSFIGGGSESSYTELNYQVIVTATVDGTRYSNKIPIESADDGDENTGNTTYTDSKDGQTYTAAYIIVEGTGTTADVTQNLGTLTANAIKNSDANKYGLSKDENLSDSTYVGYSLTADFSNTGSLLAEEITYYVWDKNGNPVLDENGNQLQQTLNFTNQDKAPSAVFELAYGTTETATEDNKSGMHRGDAYYFSYTVTYKNNDGKELVWPICESNGETTYDNKSIKTDVLYPDKQEPTFVFYPKSSNEDSITYRYSCLDPDKALYYGTSDTTEYADLTLSFKEISQSSSEIEIKTDGKIYEITLENLTANTTHTISCTQNLNKVKSTNYVSRNILSQKFEGIVNCDDITISNIICNDSNEPNNVKIYLTGDNVNRVAATQVTFENESDSMTTKLLKLDTTNGNYITVNLLELSQNENFADFINKDINVKVKIYYDNGKIGFVQNDGEKYTAYANSDNEYMKLDSSKNLTVAGSINGNMFEYYFTPSNSMALLGLMNIDAINNKTSGATLQLLYSESGLKQNGEVIVQKEVVEKQIDEQTTHTINIRSLRIGIKIGKIETTLTEAKITAKITNPLNVNVDNYVVEICHSKEQGTPNWEQYETQTISADDIEQFTLDNLAPSEYYYIKIKYLEGTEYFYTYDMETMKVGEEYEFETLATIGINNLEIQYKMSKYTEKYINISYYITEERSNMYSKTKYTFYESDGVTPVILTENNIVINDQNANYEVIEGSLIVTNSRYDTNDLTDEIAESINISPNNNVFDMGSNYILKITPIVNTGEVDYEIEDVLKEWTLSALTSPTIGLRMTRNQISYSQNIQYIKVTTSIKDKGGVIYGSDWGEYELHVYKYKEDKNDAIEVDIYDDFQNGNNITGTVFNLKENGTNYSVYIQNQDVDYSYNYYVKITLKYDKANKGINLEEHVVQYTLKAIENELGITIGSFILVQNEDKCEVRFYDSYYNIDKIDKIDYTILKLENNYNNSGSFTPEWTLVEETENGIAYYKFDLPVDFEQNEIYTIQMNLYAGNVLISQIDTTYIHK